MPGVRSAAHRTVTRNAYGLTGYAMAVGKMVILHDEFRCPHGEKLWHEQELSLTCALADIGSPTLARILRWDLARVVKRKKPTMPLPEDGWDPD